MYNKRDLIIICFLLIFIVFTVSCINPTHKQNFDFEITSPQKDWKYYSDRQLFFSTNINSDDVFWYSSIDGTLGNKNGLMVQLTEGHHTITAKYKQYEKTVSIIVNIPQDTEDSIQKKLVTSMPINFSTSKEDMFLYFVAGDTNIKNVNICETNKARMSVNYSYPQTQKTQNTTNNQKNELIRDFSLSYNPNSSLLKSHNYRAVLNSTEPANKKSFYVVNTQNQLDEPHYLEATKYYTSPTLLIYICNNDLYKLQNEEEKRFLLEKIIYNAETIIVPRIKCLWGKCADVNNDNKITFLFSSTLNEENLAVGFFNPSDFFTNVQDSNSEDYNPYSNEMDLIYLALPEIDSKNYSANSISATIAHELTHATNFSNKTYLRILNGATNVQQEELFLDEGLSHLSENLCGFGVSGGNIKFFRKFLENSGNYSFCKNNNLGQSDCAGQRGAMTLFLSWLFWKAGGMSYDKENPIRLIDEGGISFLKRIVADEKTGWETIGNAFGKNTEKMFYQLAEEIQLAETLNKSFSSIIDPITNEPIDFFVNMNVNSEENYAGFMQSKNETESFNIFPWSITSVKAKPTFENSSYTINGDFDSGMLFLCTSFPQ